MEKVDHGSRKTSLEVVNALNEKRLWTLGVLKVELESEQIH